MVNSMISVSLIPVSLTRHFPCVNDLSFFQILKDQSPHSCKLIIKTKLPNGLQQQLKEPFALPLGLLSEELSGEENKTTIR